MSVEVFVAMRGRKYQLRIEVCHTCHTYLTDTLVFHWKLGIPLFPAALPVKKTNQKNLTISLTFHIHFTNSTKDSANARVALNHT